MYNLQDLLKKMIEIDASDLHLTVGTPPVLRINGELQRVDGDPLGPNELKKLCYSILTEAQKKRFEEEWELDLSFGVKGLSRFRANMFLQRGVVATAIRRIPFKVLTFEELGLPQIIKNLSDKYFLATTYESIKLAFPVINHGFFGLKYCNITII